jgi:anti-anti-sigma factor
MTTVPPPPAPSGTPSAEGAGPAGASAEVHSSLSFRVASTWRVDEVVLGVHGDVDAATGPRLEVELLKLLSGSVRRVVVDLGSASFFDSSGLAALVRTLGAARARGVEMSLRSPSRCVRKILEISGVAGLFPIED